MVNPFTKAMKKILQLVVKHQKYLVTNPTQLAWLMNEYNLLHYASRHHPNEKWHDWENLKYAVLDLKEVVSPFYADLVYDAWASSLRNEEDSLHPIEDKPQKTMDDYVAMCLDVNYRYHSLYPNRQYVLNHYLCSTGYVWSAQGYLKGRNTIGPCGNDLEQFKGSQDCTLPPEIQKSVTWLLNPEIILGKQNLKDSEVLHQAKDKKLTITLKEIDKFLAQHDPKKHQDAQAKKQLAIDKHPYNLISKDYSAIWSLPDNAHQSYKLAAIEVCQGILSRSKEYEENKPLAQEILKRLNLEK
jgi:hypothetical protein